MCYGKSNNKILNELRIIFPFDYNKYPVVFSISQIMLLSDFQGILVEIQNGIGHNFQGGGYYFPSIFDSTEEEGYFDDGVMFYEKDIDVEKISYGMFIKLLDVLSYIYVYVFPEKQEVIYEYLGKAKDSIYNMMYKH